MKMRRLGVSIVAGTLVCSVLGSSTLTTYATPSSEELLEEQDELESELAELETQLTEILSNISTLEETITAKEEEILRAGEEYETAVAEKDAQYEAMKVRIQYMYEQSTSTAMIESIIKSTSIMDLLNKVEYVTSVYEYDKNMLDTYEETVAYVEEVQLSLDEELNELEVLEEEAAAQKTQLAALIAAAESEIAYLDEEIQAAIEAEEEAERIAAEEEAAAAEAAAAAAAQAQAQAEAEAEANGTTDSDSSSNSSSSSSGSSSSLVTNSSSVIVQAAASYIGVWYQWGGTSYSGIDCSGLTQAAYAAAGISIPRTATDQRLNGTVVGYSISDAQPGDIICYSGHVGIYIGDGYLIHAPSTGRQVCIQAAWSTGFICVVRYT